MSVDAVSDIETYKKSNQMENKPSTVHSPSTAVESANSSRVIWYVYLQLTLMLLPISGGFLLIALTDPKPLLFTLNCVLGDATLFNLLCAILALDYIPWIVLELVTFYIEYYKLGWGKSKRFPIMLCYWAGLSFAIFLSRDATEQPMLPPSLTDTLQYADLNNGTTIKCIPSLPSVSSLHYPRYTEMYWLYRLFFSRVSRRVFPNIYTTTFLSAYVSYRSRNTMRNLVLTLTIALMYCASLSALVKIRGGHDVVEAFLGLIGGFIFHLMFVIWPFFTGVFGSKPDKTSTPSDCVEDKTVQTDKK